jgi:hypothetical protein
MRLARRWASPALLVLLAGAASASTGVIPPTYGHVVVHGVPTG